MTIALYSKPNDDNRLSNNTDTVMYEPFIVTFSGKTGGSITSQLFIHNDDVSRAYVDISIHAEDAETTSRVNGDRAGWEWKIMEKDTPPTQEEWDELTAGATHQITSDIGSVHLGDTATFLSFWIYVRIPDEQSVQNIKNITLIIDATEVVVQ